MDQRTADILAGLRSAHVPVEDTLPCGLPILRKMNVPLEDLLLRGIIPLPLLEMFMGSDGKVDISPKDMFGDADKIAALIKLLNGVFIDSVIEPRFVEGEPKEGEVGVSEPWLTLDNKMYVFSRVTEAADALAPFRSGAGEPAAIDAPA